MKEFARLEGPDAGRVFDPYLAVVQQTDGWIRIDLRTSRCPKWVGKPSQESKAAVQHWLKKLEI